ncbi:MAG: DUF5663 domain-containing protein [Patescibacteria group bacterium]
MNNILRENIVKTLHLDALSATDQEKALLDIGNIIYSRVLLRVLDTLSDADKDAFDKILSKDPAADAVFVFLSSKIPNFEDVVNNEIAVFKHTSAELIKRIT